MVRLARIVIPQVPHHVTQRANRSNKLSCLVLTDYHVHLILLPQTKDGLGASLSEARRRYTRMINFCEGWRIMTINVTNFRMDNALLLFITTLLGACGQSNYVEIYSKTSPSGQYTAKSFIKNEGALGSSRYKVTITRSDSSDVTTVLRGEDGYVEDMVWADDANIIVPFCFGSINEVTSITTYPSLVDNKFRETTSKVIRVHVITSPNTHVAAYNFCEG